MRNRKVGKCKCPVCNKGSLYMIYERDNELYWEFIPSYIQCNNCGVKFSKIVVSNDYKTVERYELEKCGYAIFK